ncbi:Cell wall hydrolase CwlJ [compost metagenome]
MHIQYTMQLRTRLLTKQPQGGDSVAVIKTNSEDVRVLARLMRAEAEEDGDLGMLMVGNVGVNRILGNCLDFLNIRTVNDMVYQSPGGFEAPQKSYFYQRAREADIRLAKRAIAGERTWPATNALWFFRPVGDCPPTWYNQQNTGRFKAHCFFTPTGEDCPSVFIGN